MSFHCRGFPSLIGFIPRFFIFVSYYKWDAFPNLFLCEFFIGIYEEFGSLCADSVSYNFTESTLLGLKFVVESMESYSIESYSLH